MLGKAFDCEPGHHILNLAFLSLKLPSYQMPWASTDVPATMFAVAVDVQCLHFAAVVDDVASEWKMYAMLINFLALSLSHTYTRQEIINLIFSLIA